MPTLNIGGQKVTVGDDFLKLSPEQQNSTVEEIARTLPNREKMGKPAAAMEGIKEGASLGLHDELYGAYRASGLPEMLDKLDPKARPSAVGALITALVGAGRIGYEHLTGQNDPKLSGLVTGQQPKGEATATYEKARDEVRATSKQAQQDQPGAFLGGQVAGSLALPIGAGAGAATLPARMAAGAVTGAGVGAVSGFGSGEGAGASAIGAGTGAILGGTVGAIAPPLVEGASRAIGHVAEYPINVIRSALNPQGGAERAIATQFQNAVRADPNALNRINPNEIVPGGPAVVADALGQPGRNLARSASNLSGEASDTLNQTLQPRYEGQSQRFVNWLNTNFHYPDAFARQQALEQTQQRVNNAAYTRAREAGSSGMWSPELERLAGSDAVSNAMQAAARVSKDEAIVSGYGAFNPRVAFTADGRIQFNRGPNGVPTYPDLQFWDLTRRELSDAAQRAGHGTSEARRLQAFSRAMNTELDRLVPEYRIARQGAAGFFGAENALEAGQNFVTQKFGMPESRAALARMTPQERQLFQDGFTSRYVEWLNNVPDRADVVRQIYNTPTAREKIALALGPQRSNELEAMLRVENIMQQLQRSVTGNSTTVLQLATAGLAGAGGGAYSGHDPTVSGLAAALTVAGKRGIDQRVATRIAQMLVSQDQDVVRRGLTIAAHNNNMMGALRIADRVGAAGAQQTPHIASQLQGPMHAGAEGEQPQPEGVVHQ